MNDTVILSEILMDIIYNLSMEYSTNLKLSIKERLNPFYFCKGMYRFSIMTQQERQAIDLEYFDVGLTSIIDNENELGVIYLSTGIRNYTNPYQNLPDNQLTLYTGFGIGINIFRFLKLKFSDYLLRADVIFKMDFAPLRSIEYARKYPQYIKKYKQESENSNFTILACIKIFFFSLNISLIGSETYSGIVLHPLSVVDTALSLA